MYFQYHASAITIRMLVLAGMLRRKIGCNSSLETWTGVTQSGEPPLEKVYARLGCAIITSVDNTLEP